MTVFQNSDLPSTKPTHAWTRSAGRQRTILVARSDTHWLHTHTLNTHTLRCPRVFNDDTCDDLLVGDSGQPTNKTHLLLAPLFHFQFVFSLIHKETLNPPLRQEVFVVRRLCSTKTFSRNYYSYHGANPLWEKVKQTAMHDRLRLGVFSGILWGQSGGFQSWQPISGRELVSAPVRVFFFFFFSLRRAPRCSATVQFTVYHVFLRGLSRHQSCSAAEWR